MGIVAGVLALVGIVVIRRHGTTHHAERSAKSEAENLPVDLHGLRPWRRLGMRHDPYDAEDVPGAVSEKGPAAGCVGVSFLDVVFGGMRRHASRLWRLRSTYGTMPG
jgi:hypothetical protein